MFTVGKRVGCTLFWRCRPLFENTTTMAAADDNTTYALPSLSELAYYTCSSDHQKWYDELPGASVHLQVCCESIIKIIKLNSYLFQPHGHRKFMFAKVNQGIV